MPDPLEVLPNELWIMCIQIATDGYQTGPLAYCMVSTTWERLLRDTPSLWTQIYVQNGEDEMARICVFLHYSRCSPLHVDIVTELPSMESLQLIGENISRVQKIFIRPGSDNILPFNMWTRAAAEILARIFHGLRPADVVIPSCFGISVYENGRLGYRVILMEFTKEAEGIRTDHQNCVVPMDDMQTSVPRWDQHIVKTVGFSADWDSNARIDSIYSIAELAPYVLLHEVLIISIPSFIKLLEDGSKDVRLATVHTLCKLSDHARLRQVIGAKIPSLIERVEALDESNIVQSAIIDVLCKLEFHAELRHAIQARIALLIERAKPSGVVHSASIKALFRLADHAELCTLIVTFIPPLMEQLAHGVEPVRWSSAQVLCRLADHAELCTSIATIIPSLMEQLVQGVKHVRLSAARALRGLADHAKLRTVIANIILSPIQRLENEEKHARKSAIEMFCELGDHFKLGQVVLEPIIAALNDRSASLGPIRLLCELADRPELRPALQRALPSLSRLAKLGKDDVRKPAIYAICMLSDRPDSVFTAAVEGWDHNVRLNVTKALGYKSGHSFNQTLAKYRKARGDRPIIPSMISYDVDWR